MSLIPQDISKYYSKLNNEVLLQGDIVAANEIGMKNKEDSPDFWLIITKSCDLAFRENEKKVKNDVCSLLGIYSLKQHVELIKKKYFSKPKNGFLSRVVVAGVLRFSEATKSITKSEHLENLINDKISKLMFLPPDGEILKEPMIIDFDLVFPLSGEDIEKILNAKKIQLSSPFRERLAQRFALHYSSIGIDDNDVKNSEYKSKLKEHFKSL